MPKLESAAVERADYTPTTRQLDIWYSGGGHYVYFDVPEKLYRELLVADSIGGFVNAHIKPQFRYAELGARRRFRPSAD